MIITQNELTDVSDDVLACMTRLEIRSHRTGGGPNAFEAHEQLKEEMSRRGLNERFGVLGWDDANTSPYFVTDN